MQALKALMRREATLVQRNSFLYIFKAVQVSDAYIAKTHRSNIIHEGISEPVHAPSHMQSVLLAECPSRMLLPTPLTKNR